VEQRLGEGCDTVTGETCVPASLKKIGWGCAYLSLQVKAIRPHLALLVSSSHRLFIIHSPQVGQLGGPRPIGEIPCRAKKRWQWYRQCSLK
jgi:hypothetical protein